MKKLTLGVLGVWICLANFVVSAHAVDNSQRWYVHRVEGKLNTDGFPGKSDWSRAGVIPKFWRTDKPDVPATTQTKVYLLYDNQYLYIKANMEDQDIIGYVKKQNGPVFDDDVFEVFLRPSLKSLHYFEIDINPLGTVYAGFYPRYGYWRNSTFDAHVKVKIKINGTLNNWHDVDKGWTLEEAIPFSSLSMKMKGITIPPQKWDIWYGAFCRYDYSYYLENGVELSSSAHLRRFARFGFHSLDDYNPLIFD
ncbi:MAG: carbohydrate-binding family 9-like protein [Candidatus Omnitrophica bacterium]|nr:carbohydrate-binding family 9-like protein [Candidatus Omnitrophota bacterium]